MSITFIIQRKVQDYFIYRKKIYYIHTFINHYQYSLLTKFNTQLVYLDSFLIIFIGNNSISNIFFKVKNCGKYKYIV